MSVVLRMSVLLQVSTFKLLFTHHPTDTSQPLLLFKTRNKLLSPLRPFPRKMQELPTRLPNP
jgi:hypothetical protein